MPRLRRLPAPRGSCATPCQSVVAAERRDQLRLPVAFPERRPPVGVRRPPATRSGIRKGRIQRHVGGTCHYHGGGRRSTQGCGGHGRQGAAGEARFMVVAALAGRRTRRSRPRRGHDVTAGPGAGAPPSQRRPPPTLTNLFGVGRTFGWLDVVHRATTSSLHVDAFAHPATSPVNAVTNRAPRNQPAVSYLRRTGLTKGRS